MRQQVPTIVHQAKLTIKGFENVFKSSRYETLTVDEKQAVAEGRMTQEFLDEAIEEMGGEDSFDYTVFYKCEFPIFCQWRDI